MAIHLRDKVFQVLVCLVERRERVVSKDELLEQIWRGAAVTDDALFGCVIELRHALGDDRRQNRIIRTVPKAGYQFIAPLETAGENGTTRKRRIRLPHAAAAVVLTAVAVLAGFRYAASRAGAEPAGSYELAWWRLDEGSGSAVGDAAGGRHAGVLRGPVRWIDGVTGKALRFDGPGARVESRDVGRGFPLGGAARSVALWMRASTANGDDTSLWRSGTYPHSPNRTFHMYLSEAGRAGFGSGLTTGVVRSESVLTDGRWHFLTGVYDGPDTRRALLLVDGILEGSAQLQEAPDTPAADWRLGGSLFNETPFRGDLDDVRVYGRALRLPEAEALYRCSARLADLALPDGSPGYFLPMFGYDLSRPLLRIQGPEAAPDRSSSVEQTGTDFAGIQFARAGGACAVSSLRGADLGQDLYLGMELRVPRAGLESVSGAGPYFRSRSAAPGDGIIGGTSAGFWVQLSSDGGVKVSRLNPHEVVAFSGPVRDFDADRFHRLEVRAWGDFLEAALDGGALSFEQNGSRTGRVHIAPLWKGPPGKGENQGAAGVAFLARPRGAAGGQQVRNIVVRRYRPGGGSG